MEIIGSIVVGSIALIGTIFSAQSKKNSDLLNYRITILEKKVDKTELLENDIILLKEQIKVANHRIADLEGGKKSCQY